MKNEKRKIKKLARKIYRARYKYFGCRLGMLNRRIEPLTYFNLNNTYPSPT